MTSIQSSGATRALVLMPMLPGYENVRKAVAAGVAGAGLELLWLEQLLEDWEWLDWLYQVVRDCDIVVADPSGHNAFVMYELGIARPHRRPTLLMLDREDSQLSGSLDGSPFLPYARAELGWVSGRLAADLSELARIAARPGHATTTRHRSYGEAVQLLECFVRDTGQNLDAVGEGAFAARLGHAEAQGTFALGLLGTRLGDAGLLSALVRSSRMLPTMLAIRMWCETRVRT